MNSSQPPIFRKSMHGYNKEDVNAYISDMSRMFFEKEKEYRANLASCNAKIQEDSRAIAALEERLSTASAANAAECSALRERLANAEKQLEELKTAYQEPAETSDDPLSVIRNMASWDATKDGVSEEISIRAGKVMLAAQNAAESIIQKAQEEADNIIRGANDRKERIFHNISATADTVMTDISTYMKTAVDKCFQEIYGNLDKDESPQSEKSKRTK
ncbi:MAG: DivIVA domain-containing protein [Clostridiales bacterium]|nr:DivIVA domain-containing protein [Clostridiales bacterium]